MLYGSYGLFLNLLDRISLKLVGFYAPPWFDIGELTKLFGILYICYV